mmetsp:Transcript_63303/g.196014  ORF Transcript_63303/g.196014 Transcript_63303/m.196014 type:complete len:559 (-) Transcript_63303:214-1890(-)
MGDDEVDATTTGTGEYEDFQRDLRRFGLNEGERPMTRSMPNIMPGDAALKASDLTHIGGFRREFVHRQQDAGASITGAGSSGRGDRRASSLHPAEAGMAEEEALATHIAANMRLLTRFFGADDAESEYMEGDGGSLFEDRTTRELECARLLGGSPRLGRPPRPVPARRDARVAAAPKKISDAKACIATFKAFIGTGILFVPQAVSNAGVQGAIVLVVASGIVCTLGILLLGECHQALPRSYPELARAAFGKAGYAMVAVQIAVSQASFVSCFSIFVVNVVRCVCQEHGVPLPPTPALFAAVVLVMVPFGWIRRIGDMKTVNVLGDAIILLVVCYVSVSALLAVGRRGAAPSVVPWNPGRILCFVGTAIYTFEGIALVIPIRESMKEPDHFPRVICGMLCFFVLLLSGFGLAGYLAWGQQIDVIVLNELEGVGGTLAQLSYVLVVLFTFPIAIYPTFSICEAALFHGMPAGRRRKALKNCFRTAVTALIGVAGCCAERDLSIFVSIVGSLCSVPLELIFPAMLHLKIVGTRKSLACLLLALGICLIPVTLYADITHWGS